MVPSPARQGVPAGGAGASTHQPGELSGARAPGLPASLGFASGNRIRGSRCAVSSSANRQQAHRQTDCQRREPAARHDTCRDAPLTRGGLICGVAHPAREVEPGGGDHGAEHGKPKSQVVDRATAGLTGDLAHQPERQGDQGDDARHHKQSRVDPVVRLRRTDANSVGVGEVLEDASPRREHPDRISDREQGCKSQRDRGRELTSAACRQRRAGGRLRPARAGRRGRCCVRGSSNVRRLCCLGVLNRGRTVRWPGSGCRTACWRCRGGRDTSRVRRPRSPWCWPPTGRRSLATWLRRCRCTRLGRVRRVLSASGRRAVPARRWLPGRRAVPARWRLPRRRAVLARRSGLPWRRALAWRRPHGQPAARTGADAWLILQATARTLHADPHLPRSPVPQDVSVPKEPMLRGRRRRGGTVPPSPIFPRRANKSCAT